MLARQGALKVKKVYNAVCQLSNLRHFAIPAPVPGSDFAHQTWTASGVVSLDVGKVRRNLSRSRSKASCQSLFVPLCEIKLLTNRFPFMLL